MSERKFIHRGFSFTSSPHIFPIFPSGFYNQVWFFNSERGSAEAEENRETESWAENTDGFWQTTSTCCQDLCALEHIHLQTVKQNETPWILLLSRSVSSKPPSHLTKTDSKKNLATAAEAENRKASFWLTVTVSFCFGFSFSTWGVSPSGLCSFCRQKLSCDLARSQPKAQGSFTYIRGIKQISCNLSLLAYHQTSLPLLFTPTGNEAQGNTSVNTTPLINGKKKFYPNYKISKHT